MRIVTNEKLVARQSKVARYTTFGGLAILMASLFTSFTGNFPLVVAYILLFGGFSLAYIGALLANKWIKEPRADTALARALKGFDNKYTLYNYLLPASHLLVSPTGLVLFKVKANDGPVSCDGDKWRSTFRISRIFGGMGQEPLGNPTSDLREEITKMKNMLAQSLDNAGMVPLDGYIVFTNPNVNLAIDNCTMPVVKVDSLKDVLRKSKRGPVLPPILLQQVADTLDQAANAKAA